MSDRLPSKFSDYKVGDLRDIAENEFAVEVEGLNGKEVLAALEESGVTWEMHLANHPELRAVEEVAPLQAAPEYDAPGVVTSAQMQAQEVPVEIVVKEEVPLQSRQEWLIKMVRSNPLFEVRGVRFTSQHPYALVSPEIAEHLLTREEGFRQATPSELQEYYG